MQDKYEDSDIGIVSVGGGTTAAGLAVTSIYEGVMFVKESLDEAEDLIRQRRAVRGLNELLSQEPGAKNKETILVLISAEDHNGALKVDREIRENMRRLAAKYNVHCALIEKETDVKEQVQTLRENDKTIRHLIIMAHGGYNGVWLAGKSIYDHMKYDIQVEDLERCLFASCYSGGADSEAENIGFLAPGMQIYAPSSVAYRNASFFYLDHESKPAVIQFSNRQKHVITQVFTNRVSKNLDLVAAWPTLRVIKDLEKPLDDFLISLVTKGTYDEEAAKLFDALPYDD